MNSSTKSFIASLVLLIIFSCEEEVNKPVFQTLDVTELTSEGVTLNGKLLAVGNQTITDYGFAWAPHTQPKVSDSSFSFQQKPASGKFQHRLTDGLKNGTKYFARAYVKANNQIVYSNIIEFTALGSATPVILDFSPKLVGPNDTVVITGHHLGDILATTAVSIEKTSCKVVSVAREKIVFQVPLKYTSGTFPITLKVADKSVVSSERLTLEGPVINSISPLSGPAGTVVTITGTSFPETPADNIVYFEDKRATVISATKNALQVTVPVSSLAGEKNVSLEYNNAKTLSPTRFTLTGPAISSFTPTSGQAGTQLEINGSGFSTIPSEMVVKINTSHYVYGNVISATTDKLVVEVGDVYYDGPESQLLSNISVEVKSIVAFSTNQFAIKGPTISSIEPAQYEGRVVTVYGENFDPAGSNRVYFSNVEGGVISSTATSISVKIPFGAPTLPSQSSITVAARRYRYRSPVKYGILTPWEKLSDFPGGARYGVTTFSVGSYSYVTMGIQEYVGDMKDVWRFDPSNNSWTRMADFPGPSRAFAYSFVLNGKAYVGGGGHYGSSIYHLISNLNDLWEYDPTTDSWSQKRSLSVSGIAGQRVEATAIGQYGYRGAGTNLYRYDPALDQWSTLNTPVSFSFGGIAATIGDKGYFGLGASNATLWEFDPLSNSWKELELSPMRLQPASGTLTSFTIDNKLYAGSSNMFVRYDPLLNQWVQLPNVPVARSYKGGFASGSMGYMVTGLNGVGYADFYSFNPNY